MENEKQKHPKLDVRSLRPSGIDLTKVPIPRAVAEHLLTLPRYRLPAEIEAQGIPAGLGLSEDGYVLAINDDVFRTYTLDQQAMVLLHEFTHQCYGHIPYATLHKLNPQLFNIAADAWINEVFDPKLVDSIDGVRYEKLRAMVPALPPIMPSPRIIYNIMMADGREQLKQLLSGDVLFTPPDQLTDEQLGKLSLQQLEATAALQAAIEQGDLPEQLKEVLNKLASGAGHSGPRQHGENLTGPPIPCTWLAAVMERLRGMSRFAEYRRRRGWYRPGRDELLAGTVRRPGPLVVLGIDVSGSTGSYWGTLVATAKALAQRYRVYVVVYSDDIIYEGTTVPPHVSLSGGTHFAPLWRVADRMNAALTINITDGDNADRGANLPRSPVVWVYLPGASKHSLRPGDAEYGI